MVDGILSSICKYNLVNFIRNRSGLFGIGSFLYTLFEAIVFIVFILYYSSSSETVVRFL